MTEGITLQVALAPYLVAVGDDNRLVVYRSEHVPTSAPAYQQIYDHIIDNRMQVVASEMTEHRDMAGRIQFSQWERTNNEH